MPRDGVELSSIDTPQKASLLPSLNGPIISMLYGAMNPGSTLLAADFAMRLGSQDGEVRYQSDGSGAMVGSGSLAGEAFSEKWTLAADGGADIQGRIGSSDERLHVRSDANFFYIDGQVGSVEVHERGFNVTGPTDVQQRYVFDGTLGGLPSHTEIYRSSVGMTTYGYLGGQGSETTFNATPSADGTLITVNGSGVVAGTALNVVAALQVKPPDPPPPAPSPAPAPDPPSAPDLDIPTPDWDPVIWPPDK
jgi:hypothetical protein